MTRPGIVPALALLGLLVALPVRGAAEEALRDPAGLVAGHFARLYEFSALEAYQAERDGRIAEFMVYRRWREGGVDLVLDVVRPEAAGKWAYLFLQKAGRPDDFFIYVPNVPPGYTSPLGGPGRRVERFDASNQELDLPVVFTPLREFRPFLADEIDVERVGEERIGGVTCDVVSARLRNRDTLLDRVELAISREHGISLRSRYFRGDREVRRVEVAPQNVRVVDGHSIVMERHLQEGGGQETVLRLMNYLLDPELSDRLFSAHNLKVQRFPKF